MAIWLVDVRLHLRKGQKMDNNTSGGIGFPGVLTIVFIVLKLTKVIEWSWVWVLSPLWITLALAVICAVVVCIINK